MVVGVGGAGFPRGGGGAAVGGFAAADLELDGGVGDVEAVPEGAVDGVQDAGALGEGHLRDEDVAGEGVGGGAERPDVEVVDVEDAGDGFDGGADLAERDGAGGAFEEDVESLSDDGDGGPDDHAGDKEREDGVDPHDACHCDGKSAGDDGGGRERVAEHMDEDAADVDVSGELPEEAGDGAIHEDSGGRYVHHKAGLDGYGGVEAVDGGEADPGGEDDEGEGVDEGGEDSGALIAEGFLVGGGTGLEVDGGEGEQDCQEVGYVVAGLGHEREGVGAHAEVEGRDDIGRSESHGDLEDPLHFAIWAGDHVHGSSLARCRA